MLHGEIKVIEYESLENSNYIKDEKRMSAEDKTHLLAYMTKDEH